SLLIDLRRSSEDSPQHLPIMKLCADSTEIATHLQTGDVRSLAYHPDCYDPAAVAMSESVDYLLSVRPLLAHPPTCLTPPLSCLCYVMGVLDIRCDDQT